GGGQAGWHGKRPGEEHHHAVLDENLRHRRLVRTSSRRLRAWPIVLDRSHQLRHLESRGDEMGAAATKQTKEVTSRAIDVLDPRQVEVELAITAHRVGREPGLLNLGDPRPGEIALELQADSVELWLYGDPQHDLSRTPKQQMRCPSLAGRGRFASLDPGGTNRSTPQRGVLFTPRCRRQSAATANIVGSRFFDAPWIRLISDEVIQRQPVGMWWRASKLVWAVCSLRSGRSRQMIVFAANAERTGGRGPWHGCC